MAKTRFSKRVFDEMNLNILSLTKNVIGLTPLVSEENRHTKLSVYYFSKFYFEKFGNFTD